MSRSLFFCCFDLVFFFFCFFWLVEHSSGQKAIIELRLREREAACLHSDSQGNQLDSTSCKGSPALKSPDCVLSSVSRSLSPSCSMGLVKDRPGRRKRDSSCTSMLMDLLQPLTTEREKTDLLNQAMLGVMGTERYDELKLAQACFVSFQEFMARIKLKRKIGVRTTPRNIVEGAIACHVTGERGKLRQGIWESHFSGSEDIH